MEGLAAAVVSFFSVNWISFDLIRQLPKEKNKRRRRSFFLFHWPGCCRRSGKINDGADVKWKVFRVGGRPPLTAVFGGWKKRVARLPHAIAGRPTAWKDTNKQTEKRDSPFLWLTLVDSRCREGGLCASEMCPCVYRADPKEKTAPVAAQPTHWEKR
jgi:hypothetical protein